MKHFKDANNNVYAYDSDGSQDSFIKPNLTRINNKELSLLIAPQPFTSKQVRDNALAAIESYDFKDGRVIQIRLKDRDNLIGGIKKETPFWKMLDNKVYSVTPEDLQVALDDLEAQIAAIWMTHFEDLERGVLK